MSDITLSSAVRNNLLSLQNTSSLLETTQNRLATGQRVNSALDDPSAFFTASSLNSRAGDLNRLLDSVGLAVQTVEAADKGISSITKLVEAAQASARNALQASSPSTAAATVTGTTAALTGDAGNLAGNAGITAGDTLTFQVGGGAVQTVTLGGGGGQVNTLTDLNTALGALAGSNGIAAASVDGDGNITITADNTTDSITIGGTGDVTLFGLAAGPVAPVTTPNGTRAAAESEFNNLLTQIDQLAADASFNGNNLLAGDNLTVIFNEDGSSSLAVTGVNFDSTGLGINNVATEDFQNDTNINTTLGELDSAISTLRTQAATFGSNLSVVQIRQDFTKNLINTLETGAAGLTLADANQEAANVLALQTRQSLSSSSLSLASRSDQSVLQLLR